MCSIEQVTVSVSCGYRRQILHILSGSGDRRKLIAVCGIFFAVSHGIWQSGLQNLVEKFATENCVP